MTRCAQCGCSIAAARPFVVDERLERDFCDVECHREYIEEHFDEHMRWYRELMTRDVYE